MRKAGKFLIRGAAGIAVIFVILAAVALLLPRFVDMDSIGRDAARLIESRYHIRSDRVVLAFLPYPHAVLYGTCLSIPETLTASAQSITIYPRILPLLFGQFQPAEIDCRVPKIRLQLPESNSQPGSAPQGQIFSRLRDRLLQLPLSAFGAIPRMVVDVNNASLELLNGGDRLFLFEEFDVHASVLASKINLKVTAGKSNLWDALSFKGYIDGQNWKSSGELTLTGGSPQDLVGYFSPAAGQRLGDSPIDLNLTFSSNGLDNARADFTASIPRLPLEEGTQNAVMLNGSLAGSFQIDREQFVCTLSRLRFDYPKMSLIGSYVQKFADHDISLNIEGRETDAASVRRAILAVERENRIVRRIFEIIREGEVPLITFSAHGKRFSDLNRMENFTIRGSIENGTIMAPKVDLLVSHVHGDVVIANGILEATGVSGGTAGSSISNGVLKVGLMEGDAPFHLDLPLNADLAELPEVLRRVVPNESFQRQLSEITNVKGATQGRLILGESLDRSMSKLTPDPFTSPDATSAYPTPLSWKADSFRWMVRISAFSASPEKPAEPNLPGWALESTGVKETSSTSTPMPWRLSPWIFSTHGFRPMKAGKKR